MSRIQARDAAGNAILSLRGDSDIDGDDLSSWDELFEYGTDPFLSDTDGDQLNDGDEVNVHGTVPTSSDTDGDGMDDGAAFTAGRNPALSEPAALGPIIEKLIRK